MLFLLTLLTENSSFQSDFNTVFRWQKLLIKHATVIQRAIYLQLSSWEVVIKYANFLKTAPQAETRARQGTS